MNTRRIYNISWNGETVSFREKPNGRRYIQSRKGIQDICPLCGKELTEDNVTSIFWIVSNHVGIPNRLIHSECLEDKLPEQAFQIISEDYKVAQQYAHWF